MFFTSCTGGMVKKDELALLNQEYSDIYIVMQDSNVGSNQALKKGEKIRLFFDSKGATVKVYAYPFDQPREEALTKNLLYLFREDFPHKAYSRDFLKQRLEEKIKSAK